MLDPTQIAAGYTEAEPVAGAVETSVPADRGAPTSAPNEFQLFFVSAAVALDAAYKKVKDGLNDRPAPGARRAGLDPCRDRQTGRPPRLRHRQRRQLRRRLDAREARRADHVDMLGVAREPGRAPTTFTRWWESLNNKIGKCRPRAPEETCTSTITELAT